MERGILRDEKGIAFVVSLIMLLVLTLIGFSSVNTTTFEANITGNERIGLDAFNAAEAGDQDCLARLPNLFPLGPTPVGESAFYWTGGPQDRGAPAPPASYGLHRKAGYDVSWGFRRYRVHVTGESSRATKQIEAQVSHGPFPMDTGHNN